MAIQYTLEQALRLDCSTLESIIEDYNQILIPTADAELRALSVNSPDKQSEIEEKRNELQDLITSVGNLETAYTANNCASGINVNPNKPEPKIVVSSNLNFNDVDTNKSKTNVFTVKNEGTDNLILTGYFINPITQIIPNGWPEINPQKPLTLKPNEELTLSVNFNPIAEVQYRTTITFFSNAKPIAGSNDAITIIGRGIKPRDIGVDSVLGRKATGTKRVFVLRNVREVFTESNDNPDINSPYFDARKTKHSARILADIWQCYSEPNRQQKTQKLILEGVAIGKGVGSFWYEDCNQFIGGLLPAYQYYYDINQIENINTWYKEDTRNPLDANYSVYAVNDLLTFKSKLSAISEEIQNGIAEWGEFDPNSPDLMTCNVFQTNRLYVRTVIDTKLTSKSSIKIYDGRSDQKQIRSNITDPNKPDLTTSISGLPEKTLSSAYISKVAFGRLTCLSPNTGCYITDENPMTGPFDIRPIGEQIIKLAKNGRSAVPEQIPSDPCYRGYRTKYFKGFLYERRWEVQLNCLGKTFPEYEWRLDEALFEQRGQDFEVWEDVQFAGTEIGFNDVCIPKEVIREQEPYVDASDIRGCYELHTSKIFHRYPDYSTSGMENYIKGPETLTTQDYSGLGPGIKLSKKIQRADCIDTPVRVYHPLIKGKDIMSARDILITKGLFNHTQSLLSYNTSSYQNSNSKKYYYDVVDQTRVIDGKPISYFSVAYGNKNGSGSLYEGYEFNDSPTRAIYGQYRLSALDQSENEFKFYNTGSYSSGRKDIYAISFNRDSLTDRIDPGNFELSLSGSSGTLTLVDNSKDMFEDKFSNEYVYTSFDIVSGSLTNGIHSSGTGSVTTNANFTTYGKVYPNLGFMVLDAEKLDDEIGLNTNLGNNVDGDNSYKIFTAISGAAVIGLPLKARSSKNKKTNHYFIRAGAATSNYTNNPTVTDESSTQDKYIKNEYFKYRPTTYITTVGLYNDMNELLAVAKLSKPIIKTPDKDILIKIRLNW
jgi:hypothetical protein